MEKFCEISVSKLNFISRTFDEYEFIDLYGQLYLNNVSTLYIFINDYLFLLSRNLALI